MAAIGFIYAWQKLYPVLIFRSVVDMMYVEFLKNFLLGDSSELTAFRLISDF